MYYSIYIVTGTISVTGLAALVHFFVEKEERPAGKFKLGKCSKLLFIVNKQSIRQFG